jgi:F-box and WD-40 domain protein CDC4
MAGYQRSMSFSERRGSALSDDLTLSTTTNPMVNHRLEKLPEQQRHLRGPPTPSMSTPAADFDQQLTGSPPPPPTPAASPGPGLLSC